MGKLSGPRRSGRLLLLAGLGLLAVFGFLLYLQQRQVHEERFTPDVALIEELKNAPPPEDAPAPENESERGDWPQWRGPDRGGVADSSAILTTWPEAGPPRLWRKPIGEGYSSFAAAGGKAWTMFREGGKEVIVCWQADSGEEAWRFAYDCTFDNGYGSGPRSTPTLADGKLYTVGATGLFHCLDANTGELVWKHDLLVEFRAPLPQWGVSFSPLVANSLVYTNPGGPAGGSLAAFHEDTGDLAWKSQDDPAGYSSPVALTLDGRAQIVFFTGTALVGVTADRGEPLWRFPWKTPYHVNAATPIVFEAPRKGGGRTPYVFLSSGYGRGCALVKIEKDANGPFAARPVYEGTQMRNHFATSVLVGGYVYGFDETNLVCLDVRSGEVRWKQAGFQKGSLLAAAGHLIILGESGKLALAEATPEAYREKASFRAFRSKRCWTMPVLADGLLLVRDLEEAACYDLRAK